MPKTAATKPNFPSRKAAATVLFIHNKLTAFPLKTDNSKNLIQFFNWTYTVWTCFCDARNFYRKRRRKETKTLFLPILNEYWNWENTESDRITDLHTHTPFLAKQKWRLWSFTSILLQNRKPRILTKRKRAETRDDEFVVNMPLLLRSGKLQTRYQCLWNRNWTLDRRRMNWEHLIKSRKIENSLETLGMMKTFL